MPFDDNEDNIDFGIIGVPIEQTLSNLYDPFSGINLLEDYRQSCDYLELMLLPNQSIEENVYCNDGFSSTGPIHLGGSGGLGNCFNNGTVNVRHVGGNLAGIFGSSAFVDGDITPWYREGTIPEASEYVTEPFEHPGATDWPTLWTPNVWGYEYEDENISLSPHTAQQLSSFNFEYFMDTSPFSQNESPDYNLAEMRAYFNVEEAGQYRFCFDYDDAVGIFINDGDGGNLVLAANGPEIIAGGPGYSFGDHGVNGNNYQAEEDAGNINISTERRAFHIDLTNAKLYKILVRHIHRTSPPGRYTFNIAYQTPTSRDVNGDLPCNESFTKLFYAGTDKLYPTTINPPITTEYGINELSGDGVYYKANQTPFYGTEEIYNVLQVADCNTQFDIQLYNFDEMRAVCKDGSYVTVASTFGDTIPALTPPAFLSSETEQTFTNPELPGSYIDNLTDAQDVELFVNGSDSEWFDADYLDQFYPIGFWDAQPNIIVDTLNEFCSIQGYNDGYVPGSVVYNITVGPSDTFGRHIGGDTGGVIAVGGGNTCEGPFHDVIGLPENNYEQSWYEACTLGLSLFREFDNSSSFNLDPLYLATLPFPRFMKEFDLYNDVFLDTIDIVGWSGEGRPDVSAFLQVFVTGAGDTAPLDESIYTFPNYCYEYIENNEIWPMLPSGGGREQPIESFFNSLPTEPCLDYNFRPEFFYNHDTVNTPEDCCVRIYGTGDTCTEINSNGESHDSSHFAHGDDFRIWPSWWSRSDIVDDYLAESIGEAGGKTYYKCLDNTIITTEISPNVERIMVYWDTDDNNWRWIVMPYDDTPAGGWNGDSADFTYVTEVTCKGTTGDNNFIFETGEEACRTNTGYNSDLFYKSDNDKRPSLGLFFPKEENNTDDNFQSSILDNSFKQLPINNMIKNYTGIGQSDANNLHPNLKWEEWPDGDSTSDVYYPDAWYYIAYNGIVQRLSVDNAPWSTLTDRFIQSPSWEPGQPFDGYGGAMMYVYPNVGYEWNNSSNPLGGDGADTTNGEEIASIEHDYEWARWVERNNECLSYNKCLKFQATGLWGNIQDLLDNANSREPDFDITPKNSYKVLGLQNENQYRTINQVQHIHDESEDGSSINPRSSLKVSFYMKTMSDQFLELFNPPEVDAGIMKNSNMGFHPNWTQLGSIEAPDFLDTGGGEESCGFAFKPYENVDGDLDWRLATELMPENNGGQPSTFDNCGGGNGTEPLVSYMCSGIIAPPNSPPTQTQFDNDVLVYSAKEADASGNPTGIAGSKGTCIKLNEFQQSYPDALSCYDVDFGELAYGNDTDGDGNNDYYWHNADYNSDTHEYYGDRNKCSSEAALRPYCTFDYYSTNKPIAERYICTSWVELADIDNVIIHNTNYFIPSGDYNSFTHTPTNTSDYFGGMYRFKNKSFNTWEKKEFTYNFTNSATSTTNENLVKDLSFFVQAGNEFRGTVYLDNFEVKESYEFIPDVDVRKKLSANVYGKGDLTKYYDPTIPEQLEAYKDTQAPLEAQFYFYPRYYKENVFDETSPVYNDFRNGMFYLYNVDWGDGSSKEFTSEPEKLNDTKMVYHTYNESGIFEVTGYMIRLKYDKDGIPLGVIHNKRFTLRININVGNDEDFLYFGSEGFSFIPYNNTLPVIGGFSEQSIYYKSMKRNLGILSGENIKTTFKSDGDRLKVELSLNKMDSTFNQYFEVLPEFEIERYSEPDGSGTTVSNGLINTFPDELGKSLGDVDITSARYFNKPKEIWEMFVTANSDEYESFIDPTFISEEDEWQDSSDGNLLPEDYGTGDTPILTTCDDESACNYESYADCTYGDSYQISFEVVKASKFVFDRWDYSYETQEQVRWCCPGDSYWGEDVCGTGVGEDFVYFQTSGSCNAWCSVSCELSWGDEILEGPILWDGKIKDNQTEGVLVWQSDIPGPPITVSTSDIIDQLEVDDSNRSGQKIHIYINGNTVFVNEPYYETIVSDQTWYETSPYNRSEIIINKDDVVQITLQNQKTLSIGDPGEAPAGGFFDGREYKYDTPDNVVFPYFGCPSPSQGQDMNNFPFNQVLAGGECFHVSECKQYPAEVADGDPFGIPYYNWTTLCVNNICTIPCEAVTYQMPCWSNVECSHYDSYQQPGCTPLEYTCNFDLETPNSDGSGNCYACRFQPNPSWIEKPACADGSLGNNQATDCAECGNRSCVGNICQGGENVGSACNPENIDEEGLPNDCPCMQSPYGDYPEMCAGAETLAQCMSNDASLNDINRDCPEDAPIQEVYCRLSNGDSIGPYEDPTGGGALSYCNGQTFDEGILQDNCNGECYIVDTQSEDAVTGNPGGCKWIADVYQTHYTVCPDGTTCTTGICIDDLLEEGDTQRGRSGNWRTSLHPGNPNSKRYWKNIIPQNESVTRNETGGRSGLLYYDDISGGFLSQLPFPQYFEELYLTPPSESEEEEEDTTVTVHRGQLQLRPSGTSMRAFIEPDAWWNTNLQNNNYFNQAYNEETGEYEDIMLEFCESTNWPFPAFQAWGTMISQTTYNTETNSEGVLTPEKACEYFYPGSIPVIHISDNEYCNSNGFTTYDCFIVGVPSNRSSREDVYNNDWDNLGRPDIAAYLNSLSFEPGLIDNVPRWVSLSADEKQQLTNNGNGIHNLLYYKNPSFVSVNSFDSQAWLGTNEFGNNYYYPVLPKYNQSGHFTDEPVYPNNNIPFPMEGPITSDDYHDDSLKVSINSEYIDTNILDDKSGNGSKGFIISDFKPKFNNKTLKVEKTKNMNKLKSSKNNGAF